MQICKTIQRLGKLLNINFFENFQKWTDVKVKKNSYMGCQKLVTDLSFKFSIKIGRSRVRLVEIVEMKFMHSESRQKDISRVFLSKSKIGIY